jgi:hypothetical protein
MLFPISSTQIHDFFQWLLKFSFFLYIILVCTFLVSTILIHFVHILVRLIVVICSVNVSFLFYLALLPSHSWFVPQFLFFVPYFLLVCSAYFFNLVSHDFYLFIFILFFLHLVSYNFFYEWYFLSACLKSRSLVIFVIFFRMHMNVFCYV